MPDQTQSFHSWHEAALRLVDVGGAGGLQAKWLNVADKIAPILFEPNPAEAAKLRLSLSGAVSRSLVLETALSNVAGPQVLNIARHFGCTSLRQPNHDVLSGYRIQRLFRVKDTAQVECTRYDILYNTGQVPAPDAIKIDVQGYEYEVLQGFGALLQDCIGIELESHLYPIYRDQRLLHDLVAFLADFGFVLRGLRPVENFDGDVVELNAWFTKSIRYWRVMSETQKEKFSLLCKVWHILDYSRVNPASPHTQFLPA
jgi:FkbM family methyltransferase